MMNVRKVILILLVFFLGACEMKEVDQRQREKDQEQAIKIAVRYIKEKYQKDSEVMEVYDTQVNAPKTLNPSYKGDVFLRMQIKKKEFYVWVNLKEKTIKDTYQYEEIVSAFTQYIESIAGGKVLQVNYDPIGIGYMEVKDKEVSQIVETTLFSNKKYNGDNIEEILGENRFNADCVGSDLFLLNAQLDKMKQKNLFKETFSLRVFDYLDEVSYKASMKQNPYYNHDQDREIMFMDEQIYRYKNEDKKIIDENQSYIKYQRVKVDDIYFAFDSQKKINVKKVDTKIGAKLVKKMKPNDIYPMKKVLKIYEVEGAVSEVAYVWPVDHSDGDRKERVVECSISAEDVDFYEEEFDSKAIESRQGVKYYVFSGTIYIREEYKNYLLLVE